ERANGLALKTAVFNDSRAYAMWRFVDSLNPDLKLNIIHAGEGTLWTDLKNTGFAGLGGAKLLKKGQ
ncbi:MAG: hypothetical protein DSY90_09130, partial [Deltaproteobacteria bacterium]